MNRHVPSHPNTLTDAIYNPGVLWSNQTQMWNSRHIKTTDPTPPPRTGLFPNGCQGDSNFRSAVENHQILTELPTFFPTSFQQIPLTFRIHKSPTLIHFPSLSVLDILAPTRDLGTSVHSPFKTTTTSAILKTTSLPQDQLHVFSWHFPTLHRHFHTPCTRRTRQRALEKITHSFPRRLKASKANASPKSTRHHFGKTLFKQTFSS